MQLIEVVPLTNIPRPHLPYLTYYYPKALNRFSLIEVEVGKKSYPALVVLSKDIKLKKAFIRKAIFQLKPIKRVINSKPVLFEWQFKLASWISGYYWCSLGIVLKRFIPSSLMRSKKSLTYLLLRKKKGPQKLILVPDTSFFEGEKLKKLQELEESATFTLLTSGGGAKKQFQLFKKIALGKEKIIYGTRMAVFAPFNNLTEVHIYEETCKNHKSWDQKPKFHAVKVAQKVAALNQAKLLFYSTLPSSEMFYKKSRYTLLKNSSLTPPSVSIIDLTKEKPKTPFSEKAFQSLKGVYLQGKQAILYINRRGEASMILCRDCGFTPRCPSCDLPFTYHSKGLKKLLCHHCNTQNLPPTLCPQCNSHEVYYYGFGTERVEGELKKLFPKAKIFRLDSDVVANERMKKMLSERFLLQGNFLVTTSMIFQTTIKPVDTVIVLSADTEMNIPDFASYERLFFNLWRLQNLAQREFMIQTYNPENYLFRYVSKNDWESFYQKELKVRKFLSYPPFSRIVRLSFEHPKEEKVVKESSVLYEKLTCQVTHLSSKHIIAKEDIKLLGPAPAFLPKLKGKYRYQILIKIKGQSSMVKSQLLSVIPPQWDIDVDPVELL